MNFKNRLGIAGGVDKNAECVKGWWSLGAGFIEVGTITPQAQGPNAGRILDRSLALGALWNRMGFPNGGATALRSKLEGLGRPYATPLFVNVGKNRETPLERASADYISCMETVDTFADAFVLNVSSPNTAGLRSLLTHQYLVNFLEPIVEFNRKRNDGKTPLLLKLSPDLSRTELEEALLTSLKLGIDGWILTNTTLHRDENSPFPSDGGVSGAPLRSRSEAILEESMNILGEGRRGKLIVSVGGVMDPSDVKRRLDLGADLVQVYSALIFHGPGFFRRVARDRKDRS